MKPLLYFCLSIVLLSCGNQEKEKIKDSVDDDANVKDSIVVDKSELVEIKGNLYTEYYNDRKSIKFQGTQDEAGLRNGKWLYFSINGDELSMTMYEHGKKHGHTIVKYPNGAIHYTGEYQNDVQVGEWKTYNTDGKMFERKDYGYPK